MRDCVMGWNANEAESVMAALMDFDKLCPKQPSRRKQRVLSDAYISKAASIGRRRESLLPIKPLSQENGNVLCMKEKDTFLDKSGKSGTNQMNIDARSSSRKNDPFLESLSGTSPEDRKVMGKNGKHSMQRNVLRCRQKPEHDTPCIEYMSMSLKCQLEMIDKRCHFPNTFSSFDPKSRKVSDVIQDGKWDYRRYKERREHLRPKEEEHHDASAKRSCVSCSRTMSRSWNQDERFTKLKDVWIPGIIGNTFREIKVNSNDSGANIEDIRDDGACDGLIGDRCMEIDASERVSDSINCNLASHCLTDDSFASLEASKIDMDRDNGFSYSKAATSYSSKDSEQSFACEVGREEELTNVSSEGESAYTKYSESDTPEFKDELNGHYQLSPDSVLQQSYVQIPSIFKHFENAGLWKQLQFLNIELEETYSEESALVVSDEEDEDQTSVILCKDDIKIEQWFGDDGSTNYSYMVDVLDESRLFSTEPYMDFNEWHSLECPMSPSLFEDLEVKYGKQKSLGKNHRRLLFDRINSGLVSIFNPIINSHVSAKTMKRKFSSCLRRDEVEDELWRILTCQEKAKTQYLSEKAVDEWLEFEEGVGIVCSELECCLVDELVMEFVSL